MNSSSVGIWAWVCSLGTFPSTTPWLVLLLAAVTSVQLSAGLVKCCCAALSFWMSDFFDTLRSMYNLNFIPLCQLIGQSMDLLNDPYQDTKPSYTEGKNLIPISLFIHCETVETCLYIYIFLHNLHAFLKFSFFLLFFFNSV